MSHAHPTVFVIIPVFNRLALTETCVRCLSAQTYPALRIIVVDGGSTDGTPEQIRREYPHAGIGLYVSHRTTEAGWTNLLLQDSDELGMGHVVTSLGTF